MRNVFFLPPLKKVSGGLFSLLELAAMLAERGPAAAVCPQADCPALRLLDPAVERLPWDGAGAFLRKDDLWIIPDGWPSALLPGLKAGARGIMYVQNWAFMLTDPPQGVPWRRLPLECLAVSRPVDWFLREVLGLPTLGVLPPAIAPEFFAPEGSEAGRGAAPDAVRIAWMPRKNAALARQMQAFALARLEREAVPFRTEFVEIHGRDRSEVAALLRACHIFLATGFPEGFGLPPLEAMASGCVPVGFSGLGGFEYMRNPAGSGLPGLYSPPFPLPERGWGGNGLFAADGDIAGAGLALAWSAQAAHTRSPEWRELRRNGRLTAAAYTRERRKEALGAVWPA